MQKFLIRAASGIVYAAIIITAILCGQWSIYALALVFAAIGMCELNHMCMPFNKKTLPVYAVSIICVLILITFFESICYSQFSSGILTLLFIISIILYYFASRKARNVSLNEFANGLFDKVPLFGVSYLGIPLGMMTLCFFERLSLLVFFLLWLNDSGAYIVGSLIGRHKLCPSISPAKTWEGFIGGGILTVVGAYIFSIGCPELFKLLFLPTWMWILIGVATCIFGTLGDLLESKIKRTYSIKDSGHWIPGHGGILDRIDSFLLAYPVIAILVYLYIYF